MIKDTIEFVMNFFKTKIYKNGELDIESKKFDTAKFLICSSVVFLTIIVLLEGYLIYGLAKKYNKLEIAYIETQKTLEDNAIKYRKEINSYKNRFDELDKEYKYIDKCLKEKSNEK